MIGETVRIELKEGHGVTGVLVSEEKDRYWVRHASVTGYYEKNFVKSIEALREGEE